jgi:hypothetical protein
MARPVGDAPQIQGSPTRRRLLALLSSLSIIAVPSVGADQGRACRADAASGADPMPRLFAEFQALLDRHAAEIVTREGIEAALVARIGWTRVALPGGSNRRSATYTSSSRAPASCLTIQTRIRLRERA